MCVGGGGGGDSALTGDGMGVGVFTTFRVVCLVSNYTTSHCGRSETLHASGRSLCMLVGGVSAC